MAKKRGNPNGQKNLISLDQRPVEERRRISQMGVEARKKKADEKKFLQKNLRELLKLRPSSRKQKEILREMGIEDADITNSMLLMTALFRKGLTGDVAAISKVVEMVEKLELFEDGKEETGQNILINLIQQGEQYTPTEEDEQDIWKAEQGLEFTKPDDMEEWNTEDDDWGDDVYDG